VEADRNNHPHETILLVEDEKMMRWNASRALRKAGYSVLEAKDAREALQLAAHCPAGETVFVIDALLSGTTGTAVAASLKALHPKAPILFLAGYSSDVVDAAELERLGASILSQTVTMEALIRRVRQILDGSLPQPKLHTTVTAGHKLL